MNNLLSKGIQATLPSFIRGILKAASNPDIISFAGGSCLKIPRKANWIKNIDKLYLRKGE